MNVSNCGCHGLMDCDEACSICGTLTGFCCALHGDKIVPLCKSCPCPECCKEAVSAATRPPSKETDKPEQETGTLTVQTPAGKLSVEEYTDSDYPGFTLYLDGEQVGVFEYDSSAGTIRVHVWDTLGTEDHCVQLSINPAAQTS